MATSCSVQEPILSHDSCPIDRWRALPKRKVSSQVEIATSLIYLLSTTHRADALSGMATSHPVHVLDFEQGLLVRQE